ncbi:MAG TPA: DUF4129 domain-containing protein [Thermomicrobiales bacterium]|nr:DUF4129 domain-containing protein [Thermomicrobiales bacterium]
MNAIRQEDEVRAPRRLPFDPSRFRADNRLRLLGVAAAATILIVLAAVASRPVALSEGATDLNSGPAVALIHIVEILGIALELLTLLILVVFLFPRERRKPEDEFPEYHEPNRAPWWLKLLVFALSSLAATAIFYAIVHFRPDARSPQPITLVPPEPTDAGFGAAAAAAFGLGWWEVLIAAALAVAAFAAILLALRRPSAAVVAQQEPERRTRILAEAVGASLDDARRERDPRRAVIAAYATMERVLADHGLPRSEVEAPLEYMSRLFGELNVGQEAIRTLTSLFEVARFSHHQIAPAAKAQAILALVALQEELRPSS